MGLGRQHKGGFEAHAFLTSLLRALGGRPHAAQRLVSKAKGELESFRPELQPTTGRPVLRGGGGTMWLWLKIQELGLRGFSLWFHLPR